LGTFDEEAQTGIPQRFYSVNRPQGPLAEDEQGLHPSASQRLGGLSHKSSRGPSPSHH
jgi:hypothetical protein